MKYMTMTRYYEIKNLIRICTERLNALTNELDALHDRLPYLTTEEELDRAGQELRYLHREMEEQMKQKNALIKDITGFLAPAVA